MKLDWQRIIESFAPIVVACLLWALVFLIVFLAVAGAGGRWLEVLIAGIGAVGQVFFAWMVWRLGKAQFHFTKTFSEKQERLELNDRRVRFVADYKEWANRYLNFSANESDASGIMILMLRARTIYPQDVIDSFGRLIAAYTKECETRTIINAASKMVGIDPADLRELQEQGRKERSELFSIDAMLQFTMTSLIDGDFRNGGNPPSATTAFVAAKPKGD